MQVEQEYDTPGEALLAHHGVKGMRWGHTTVDAASAAVSNTSKNAKASVKGAAAKTSASVNKTTQNAKAGVRGAADKTSASVNSKVQGVKDSAKARADAKKAKVSAKGKAVAENKTVKDVGHEFKGWAWGTRQAYIEKTLKDAERAAAISKGTAGIDSKVVAAKDGVIGKRSAKFANKVFEEHAAHMKSGQLRTRDILLASARLRRRDLTIGMDIAGKKNDAAKKRGREAGAQFKIPVGLERKAKA